MASREQMELYSDAILHRAHITVQRGLHWCDCAQKNEAACVGLLLECACAS